MKNIYQTGKAGNKTLLEKKAVKDIQYYISNHNAVIDKVATTPDELYSLRDKLKSEYGEIPITSETPSSDSTSKSKIKNKITDPDIQPELESNSEEFDIPEGNFESEPSYSEPTTSIDSEEILENYNLSDFEEIKPGNSFDAPFKQDDLFKADNQFEIDNNNHENNFSNEEEVIQSVRNPWESRAETAEENEAIKSQSPTEEVEEITVHKEDVELSEEEKDKIALAKKTSAIATKSLAKQTAKIFDWITTGGAKWYSKISDKKLDQLEEKGLLDRNFILDDGRTISSLIDEHNELIDELLETDPEMLDELIDALLLVAQKHEIQVSPEANLGMVVITMLISKFKTGHDAKKQINKVLKKSQDIYLIQTRNLADAESRASQAEEELARLKAEKSIPSDNSDNSEEENIRRISFGSNNKKVNQIAGANINIGDNDPELVK